MNVLFCIICHKEMILDAVNLLLGLQLNYYGNKLVLNYDHSGVQLCLMNKTDLLYFCNRSVMNLKTKAIEFVLCIYVHTNYLKI